MGLYNPVLYWTTPSSNSTLSGYCLQHQPPLGTAVAYDPAVSSLVATRPVPPWLKDPLPDIYGKPLTVTERLSAMLGRLTDWFAAAKQVPQEDGDGSVDDGCDLAPFGNGRSAIDVDGQSVDYYHNVTLRDGAPLPLRVQLNYTVGQVLYGLEANSDGCKLVKMEYGSCAMAELYILARSVQHAVHNKRGFERLCTNSVASGALTFGPLRAVVVMTSGGYMPKAIADAFMRTINDSQSLFSLSLRQCSEEVYQLSQEYSDAAAYAGAFNVAVICVVGVGALGALVFVKGVKILNKQPPVNT